ncbi:MAG: formylglycine-generating enzyme family protein [Treponema sp.]|nr:formylglycine-generating enzyme family protein [Treponema sp.]MCL2252594.1 formylglycine-generating enzyme family protein [Treponema sp.]
MKCVHCDCEWKTSEKLSLPITKCPFCGENPNEKKEQKSYENSKDALAAIYTQFGADVLLGDKLNAYFPDFAPSVSANIKDLVYAVYKKGSSKVLKQNLNSSQEEKERAVKIAVRNLTEAFIAPEMAENIIYEFIYALGWKIDKPKEAEKQIMSSSGPSPKQLNSIPANFVYIEGGTFMMGSPANEAGRNNNEIQHQVTISPFYICKFAVTQKEYREVMGTNPSWFNEDNLPIENINWLDAIEYCNVLSQREGIDPVYTIYGSGDNRIVIWNRDKNGSLGISGYRLPTEAEWEYACRAGTTVAYNTGAEISDNTGWYEENSGKTTHTVGQKPANAWGLFDMHGNVSEWCWDRYNVYINKEQTDPIGPDSGDDRVVRGGSWNYYKQNLRSAYRDGFNPTSKNRIIGFRLVRS